MSRDRWTDLAEVISRVPGALRQVENFAAGLDRAAQKYRATHWGDQGTRPAERVELPDTLPGLVLLGDLATISYLTQKGKRRPVEEFVHTFGGNRLPVLAHTLDGDLVIVRSASRYTVDERGIVG